MEVNVAKPEPCLAQITLSVPANEFEAHVNQELSRMRSQVRMKGFRPGKAPLSKLKKDYGENIREEAKQHFLRLAFSKAVEENDLKVFGNPRVTPDDLSAVELPEGNDFSFDFEAILKPSFKIADYKGLKIESELAQVMDEEIDSAIEQFRQRQARPEEAGEEGLPEDGMVMAQLTLEHEGETVLERSGMTFSPSQAMLGIEDEEWKTALTGAQKDQVIELTVTLPPDVEKEEARGEEGLAKVTCKDVYKLVPPTDEELARVLGHAEQEGADKASAEELTAVIRSKVKEQLVKAHENQENSRIEAALFDQLLAVHEFDLPESMVADQLQGRLTEMRSNLAESGQTEEQVEQAITAAEGESREAAEKSVRGFFLLETIAQAEDLAVTDDEMAQELRVIAQRNQASFDEVVQFYRQNNQMNQLALEVAERKVRKFLRENAEISQPS